MANASFTRDEVILTLDVLYSSENDKLSPSSKIIAELSDTLRKLPIHPEGKRPENFRNCVGISHQIERFRKGYSESSDVWNVGSTFYQVATEYKGRHDALHETALAIRRNIPYYSIISFGAMLESDGFPEGALLAHLHRIIEKRDGQKVPLSDRCDVCQLQPEKIYNQCGFLLEHHLIVPPVAMNGKKTYSKEDFITVCPNCHAALHRHRPWLNKENCAELLRN